MRLLADENIPMASVHVLREAGHDVEAVGQLSPGITDEEVMRHAAEQGRTLLTFDRDFGALAFLGEAACPGGVVLLRFRPADPTETGELIAHLIQSEAIDMAGQFTVIDRERIRQRPLPRGDA